MIEPALATTTPPPEEDVTTTLYRAAIGPVSNGYYLPIFTRFEAADHAGISWNTAAALSTLNWLVFRRLWVAALAYFGALVAVGLLVFGIGRLVFQMSDTLLGALALGFGLAAFVLPGLFGNAVFHTECRKRMSQALIAHSDIADARTQLLRQAGTRKRAIILAALNVVALVVAVLAYLQFSALSNLTVMPAGALEAGHVVVGRAVDAAPAASSPVLPEVPPAPPTPAASAAASPASATASAPATSASAVVLDAAIAVPSSPASASASASTATTASAAAASAPLPKEAAATTMAMVDTVRQNVAKPQAAIKPVTAEKPAKPVKNTKPYFVNVGLFAVAENAERAHAKLLAAQLPSTLKELVSSKGQQIRVRVGPFVTRQDAQDAARKIKALQLDAMIVQP
jgi:cell division septation protein DedD